VLESGELQAEQAWRKDHIRSKIARTYLWLGESRQAAPFEAQLVDSEIGNVQAAKARLADPDSLEERFAALDQLVSAGNLDQVRAAIDSYTELFDRFYDQEERRSKIQQQLLEASKKLPPRIGLELRMDLAGLALEHGDRDHALGLVEDAYLSFESGNWDAENHVPFAARLAGLRYRAGEEQRGRVEAKVALARFDAERNTIIDVLRTEVLIPLAEAYQAMGDDRSALAGYGKALDEAVINPNSRPRAENLAAICLSMARNAVQPTDELRERLSSVAEKLGDPW
jgi:tetratricopeptide (TPR) repeat protein